MAFEFKITATVTPGNLAKFGPLIPGRVLDRAHGRHTT
jgi:hypothetical protein